MMTIPYVDPSVKHVGVAKLRQLNADALRSLTATMVVQDGDEPLAVVVPYKTFLLIQTELREAKDDISL